MRVPEHPDPQLMLQHTAWLRSLVRGLIRGEQEVEEVLQDTWVAALERPPRSGKALPAWLARVARNFAFTRRRSSQRRARREHRAARPEGVASSQALVERAELHTQVVQAVLALEEPYRSTLLMRYFEDLTPNEIARRSGIPPATVRSRIKRALDRLRVHFGRSCQGNRDVWCAALLPLALPSSPSAAATTGGLVLGAVAMSTKVKIALVLLPLLGAALGVVGQATLSANRSPAGARATRPLDATANAQALDLAQRENRRLLEETAALKARLAALEGRSEPAPEGALREAGSERAARSASGLAKGLDAVDWDGWVPKLRELVAKGSLTDPELMTGARGLVLAIMAQFDASTAARDRKMQLADLLPFAPVGSRLAAAALADAAGQLEPEARAAVQAKLEQALAAVESRQPNEPLGLERMASVLEKLTRVEQILSQQTDPETAELALAWLEPLWQRKYWSRLRLGAVDRTRFIATQLESMGAILPLDAPRKTYAKDLFGRAWTETKQLHAGLVARFGRDTVRAALLPAGGGGADEAVLARERQRSGFAAQRRSIEAAYAQLQSRYDRRYFSALDKRQQETYRTVAGSVLLFDPR